MVETYYLYSLRCNFCGTELKDGTEPFSGVMKARSVARETYGWMYIKDQDVCQLCVLCIVQDAIETREKEEKQS